ncbi:hypothetical protein CFN78_09865 [Amycolatopsis antarctica]|uniref:DUF427 domain-containing protein n=1 Tax=Amycolatopsis antarctica TaxID=1854586 RepID=A0A263D3W7_9PSEU|nr:DUF427 domain-containing protein [Amycolatopsis antarctica]OZM73174.1 hypothetical protein CFN78_09865 [Amycolatopsis antarctica]
MDQLRAEQGPKRVRAVLSGKVVADTIRPLLVWEVPYYPTYFLPAEDVGELPAEAVTTRPEVPGHVRIDWQAMDAWFEEDEEVFVHPRDPGVRVDILPSSRHVRVEVDGVTVADTRAARLLFETNLPTRYYLPKLDVRLDLLERSDTVTRCPYKGTSEYFSVRVNGRSHRDLAWSYPTPLWESQKVAGLVCFLDEQVDVFLDGVRQERPVTKFG